MKFEIHYCDNHVETVEADTFSQAVEMRKSHLAGADLRRKNLRGVNLSFADLADANLTGVDLTGANLARVNLSFADLSFADLTGVDLIGAKLIGAKLIGAKLIGVNLTRANLTKVNLSFANLTSANLTDANLTNVNLTGTIGLIKLIGVKTGNIYWKRFDSHLNNRGYQFRVGLNELRKGEEFASDERVICSHPGFHFASRSWCAANYPNRPLEAKIRIPEKAKINEPWATSGQVSADMIEILQVFDMKTGKDVTEEYK